MNSSACIFESPKRTIRDEIRFSSPFSAVETAIVPDFADSREILISFSLIVVLPKINNGLPGRISPISMPDLPFSAFLKLGKSRF